MPVELRSDTFTLPSEGMLQAMFEAKVGDDVFGEDPTVNELEKMTASLFGMEDALFCPSGTMSNQIAIKVHTQPGDEIICHEKSHVYQYEGGGIGFNSGCASKLLPGDKGQITAGQILDSLNNPHDPHKPVSKLVVLENTSNMGGGTCYELETINEIRKACDEAGLLLHLDGARLANAIVHKRHSFADYGHLFHSVSLCLSKGLGAPVGTVLTGTAAFIRRSRRIRKVLGGGMRQAGYLAAAGIYALNNNIERLQEDHDNARETAEILKTKNWVKSVIQPETNILLFDTPDEMPARGIVQQLEEKGIRCMATQKHRIRMVFHLNVGAREMEKLKAVLAEL